MAKLNDSCFWPPYWCPSEGFQHAISPLSSKKLAEIFFKYLAYEKLHRPEFWWGILLIYPLLFYRFWTLTLIFIGATVTTSSVSWVLQYIIQKKEINLEKMKNYHLSKHSCNPFVTFSHFVNLFFHLIGKQFVGGDILPY